MGILRKGQISVYLVVASLIVILVAIYFVQAPQQSNRIIAPLIPSQTQEFQDGVIFMKSCLDDAAETAVGDFAISGMPRSKKILLLGEIPRAVFSTPDDVPTPDKVIETLRASFETQLDNCLMDQEFPYDLIAEDATVDVSYSNGRLLFRTYPIVAKRGSMSRTYDPFVNSVTYPLDEYLRDAKAAMEAMTLDPGNINMSTLISMKNYHTINQNEDEVYDITLSSDQWTGTSYSFIAQVRQ